MEIDKICRTCLGLTGPLLSIYDSNSIGGTAGCLADMLMAFTKTKPNRADNLPYLVCLTCISEINRCYSFKLKCENSLRTLKQLLPDTILSDDSEEEFIKLENVPKKANKSVQTKPICKMETSHRAVQTQLCETRHKKLQTDEMENSKQMSSSKTVGTSPINRLFVEAKANFPAKRIKLDREAKRRNSEVKVSEIPKREFIEIAEYVDDQTEYYEISEEQYEYTEDENDKQTLNLAESIIIEDESNEQDEDSQYTQIIYDESPEDVEGQEHGEEFNFTIYNNEDGEAEIETKQLAKLIKRKPANREGKLLSLQNAYKARNVKQINTIKKHEPVRKILSTIVDDLKIDKVEWVETMEVNSEPPKEMSFFCDRCNAGFAIHKSLVFHRRQNACTNKNYKCEDCDRVFISEETLSEHQATHELATCTDCDKMFDTQDELNKHMVDFHKRNMKNQCEVCKKVFTMLSTLKDHMRTHTGEKPYICKLCDKGFSQNANLKQHMLRHSDIKRFKCDLCNNAYVTKAELASHERTHTGDKPYACEYCEARFTTSCSLVKHKRKHTGERPYACDICPLRFTALNVLKNHRRTHTGEKPYQCSHCPKRFTQKGDCLMHQRTHQTGGKSYHCSVCSEVFNELGLLRAHMLEHEKEDEKYLQITIMKQNPDDEEQQEHDLMEQDDVQLSQSDSGHDLMQLAVDDMC